MLLIRDVVEIILLVAKEMYKLLTTSKDFKELEQGIFRIIQEMCIKILISSLRYIDDRLMEERDKKRLRFVNKKSRTLLTPFGEITIERRYYKDKKTGERKFLLDEVLGLEESKQLSPWLKELAVTTASEMTYEKGARFISAMTLGTVNIAKMSLWNEVQGVGKEIVKEAEEKRNLMFEEGLVPEGKIKSSCLNIEADEVYIKGREGKKLAIKIGVGYEGKKEIGKERRELINRRVISGIRDSREFWEEAAAELSEQWRLYEVDEIYIGGDGARWIKEGCEYFPQAVYRLDRYHLRRALLEGLGHDEEGYNRVLEALAEENLDKLNRALNEAEKRVKGTKKKQIGRLKKYINNNWEGICYSSLGVRLGTIEGQAFHHIARRMKRHGARWSKRGADHLSRLLAKKANGELEGSLRVRKKTKPEVIKHLLGEQKIIRDIEAKKVVGNGEWLRATVPALYGSSQDQPWVKHVMRYLVKALPGIA